MIPSAHDLDQTRGAVVMNESPPSGNAIFQGRDKDPETAPQNNGQSAETKCVHESPPVRGYSHWTGKSPFAQDWVVGLRGLELRARHAVAIEPVSR
jgi:hypothetical protein